MNINESLNPFLIRALVLRASLHLKGPYTGLNPFLIRALVLRGFVVRLVA